MSISNSILKMLNFKEKNLIFSEDFCEERIINKKRCLIIKGYLKNEFEFCPKCGCYNDGTIIKKGIKTSLVKINKISGLTSYLEVKKQNYKCYNCGKKTVAKSDIVDYGCTISNNVKIAVFNQAQKIISKRDIANDYNVSDMTVQRIFDKNFNDEKLYKNYLPEAICIDEFTYKKRHLHLIYVMQKLERQLI